MTCFQIIEELIDHVRANQHDFNNQLMAIQILPESYKNYESLVNAMEATPKNGTATLILDSHNNKIEIITKNIGPALTPELSNLLFTKGYSTKTSFERKRGFGLYNLKQVVGRYNGTICLSNEVLFDTQENLIVFEIIM